MWTRQNKTRLGEWEYSIQKPMANNVVMRNWLFVALVNGYIVPADETTEIEGCAINDRFSWENNEHRYCIYQPKRDWETFTMEVDNGTLKQEDVGKTFWITGTLQHINYTTKAEVGGQFRLEEVLNDNLWTFTYNKHTQFAPQGPQGNDGQTPELEMWTVTKLQPNEMPTATLVPDPQDPNKYTLNLGIPAWATWEKGSKGDQGDKWDKGNTWTPGQDGSNWTNWTNGTDWVSPHREWDWNWGTTYTPLAMVRYPDTNNEYWTWIWKGTTSTTWSTPGVDPLWWKMNKDGDTGPQGEAGGTIVIPVEGKPGKDWIGVDGKDWKNWVSPHNEGDRVAQEYSELALVRAPTGELNAFWDEIRGRFITENWAGPSYEPKAGGPWELVVKDGDGMTWVKDYIDDIENNVVTLGLARGILVTDTFYDDTSNMDVMAITFDRYTGNDQMIYSSWTVKILRDGHYHITGHCILKLNWGWNQYLNLGRYSVALSTSRTGSAQVYMLWTGKAWWPATGIWYQGPWLDLSFNIYADLYAWDMLFPIVRCQSDQTWLKTAWEIWTYKIIGADDTTGEVPGQVDLDSYFATYLWVKMVSHRLFNWWNVRQSI